MEEFNGVTWNTSDLEGCKQALLILLSNGVDLELINNLDFGNLWVERVIEEYFSIE